MTKRTFDLARMHRKLWQGILWGILALSLLSVVFSLIFPNAKFLATLQAPMVLAALLVIIAMLNPVEEIHTDVRFLRQAKEATPSRTYSTQQELYMELNRAVEKAQYTLDLTHIRDQPPRAFGDEADRYTETVFNWVKKHPDRSARRIISLGSAEMREWAKQLQKAQQRIPRYHIRVVDWSIAAPALNMAIIDGQAVFLALTGDTYERTRGFAIEDGTTAEYFAHYYATLWSAGVDLSDYLLKSDAG